jgi:hypothetical protein
MRSFARQIGILAAALFACLSHGVAAADLPRVMILGDDLFMPAAAELVKALSGKAVVVHVKIPSDLPPSSASAVVAFDRLVGKEKWNVIHFNFGIGDLIHRAPGMKSFRVMAKRAGGIPVTTIEEYERNLNALVQKLSQTGARLIWASTPPIPTAARDLFVPGSEIAYNQRAAAVMARYRIPVNDLHAYVSQQNIPLKSRIPDVFTLPKSFPFHPPILAAIEPVLGQLNPAQVPPRS